MVAFLSPSCPTVCLSAERPERSTLNRQEAQHDTELIRCFLAGDSSAFDKIVTRHHDKMFAIAFSVLHNRADAEEIAQDTFIRAHRGLVRFRGDSALGTWLHRIALNLSRNRYWHNFRRCQHVTRSLDTAFAPSSEATLASLIACEAPGPVRTTITREFSDLVTGCMRQLGPAHREILTQRNLQNRSYDEIACAIGISVGTVKSRLARARGNLRTLLAQACPEFAPDAPSDAWFDPVRPSGGLAIICA
jgi:RNA polymerase sigma-70 factor (ECF subfamily)